MTYFGRHTRSEASTSGFHDSPGPPLSRTGTLTGPAKRPTSMVFFVVFLWHLTPLSVWCDHREWILFIGRYRWCRARTEVHLSVVDESGIDLNIANWHSNTKFKLELKRRCIYYTIIGLLVWFGRPPRTMDAVSATIVVGGQPIILKQEVSIEICWLLL